jgi:hypothetical protein
LVSKLKTRESLLDKKPDRKVSVLTELKLDGTSSEDHCFKDICTKGHKTVPSATL